MVGLLERLCPGARVAIVRLRSLGDCVLTTPAIRLLKSARPDLSIAVVVEPRFADIYRNHPDIAEVLAPSLPVLRAWNPDLCINFHGGTRSTVLTGGSKAEWRAGFAHFRHGAIYNIKLPRAQEVFAVERTVHTAEHLASAMFFLGVPPQDVPAADLPTPAARTLPRPPYALLHPFASQPDKAWPADRFAQAASELAHSGLTPVFLGSAADDFTPFRAFEVRAGQTLAESMSLVAGASLFIGNDSGPAHIAAAYRIPLVVLFGPSDAQVWAPWKTPAAEQIVSPKGLSHVSLDMVLSAAERLRVAA